MHQAGYPDGIGANANTARALGIPEGTTVRMRPYLMFRTAQGDFVPWVASQSDILADDWQVLDDASPHAETGLRVGDLVIGLVLQVDGETITRRTVRRPDRRGPGDRGGVDGSAGVSRTGTAA